ncbi:MAG: 4-hydroxy-tetrahydrodipicolinate reductase [Gammaproteobacteria bacterium]|nr:4-hydroxy-tetrahydrodipicolinate reductase [Gammaproteobacteria bacterium]
MAVSITISGANGRMGSALIAASLAHPEIKLRSLLVHSADSAPRLQRQLNDADVLITTEITESLLHSRCLIDFTRPKASIAYLQECVKQHLPMVIGTTGFTLEEEDFIRVCSRTIPIVYAPNMSIGVNVCLTLLAQISAMLKDYDVEIMEAHHRYKVDAPSGTALKMGEIIAKAQGLPWPDAGVFERHGIVGVRPRQKIGFSSVRAGDIVGEHTVVFATAGERIEITHKSNSREHYAKGGLQAAQFVQTQAPGLYDMSDVIQQHLRLSR